MNPLSYIISIIIVIITIIIIIFFYKKDHFIVKTDIENSTDEKNIEEIYSYPGCTGCITYNSRKIKPKYKYNISDDRCVRNSTTGYINSSYLDNIMNYTGTIEPGLSTCYSNYNSIYSSIRGKYIILFRTDSIKMKFNHISVHERDITKSSLSTGSVVFSTNLYMDISGNYIFPETALDSTDTSTIIFMNGPTGSSPSYVIITLPNSVDIGYINIRHSNSSDAATLNGATLVILNDNTSAPTNISILPINLQKFINYYGILNYISSTALIVFYTILNNNNINRIIYTYNHLYPLPSHLYRIMKIINEWTLPCTNCVSMEGKLFKGHFYKSATGTRCYKPIIDGINKNIFDTEISSEDLDTKFESCSPQFDTRYLPSIGTFIQISRSDGRSLGLKIAKIRIYADYAYNEYLTGSLPSLSALVNTYINDSSLFNNTLDDNESTLLVTTDSATSKILINVGAINKNISGIGLKIPTSERYNIVGLKINVIKIDESDPFNVSKMRLTSDRTILNHDVDITSTEVGDTQSYTYLILLSGNRNDLLSLHSDIIINNEVSYNSINKYLTTYKNGQIFYQIPYVIYRMVNGRSLMAKSLVDSTSIIDKIDVSDAVTLFNFSSNTNVSTVPGKINSHILNPIIARYVQIKPDSTQSLPNVIQSIILYNSDIQIIKSVTNPIVVFDIPHVDYGSYIRNTDFEGTTKGYILIDLEKDKPITFVKIVIATIPQLTNAVLNLINNSGNKVFTYTFTNPTTTNYVITDMNEINQQGPHFINKVSYPSCTYSNVCNNVASNTYYVLDDGRCFKSNDSISPDACTGCLSRMSSYYEGNLVPEIGNMFTSCSTSKDTRLGLKFYSPFLLRMDRPVTMSTDSTNPFYSGNPFYSTRNHILEYREVRPPRGFSTEKLLGGIRIYTELINPVKFNMVRFVNYFSGGGNNVAPTDTDGGVKEAKLYVTNMRPSKLYGETVTSNDLLWSGIIPKNTGIPASGMYWPHNDVSYYPTNPLYGKYIILDIINNWGSTYLVGIEKIDFVVEPIKKYPYIKFPITGRYIKYCRIDDQILSFSINKVYVYDRNNNKYTPIGGTISPNRTWDNISNSAYTSYSSTPGLNIGEYMLVDLGSMKEISDIEIIPGLTSTSGNPFDSFWKFAGVVCQVLTDGFDVLGEYEIYDSIITNYNKKLNITDLSTWITPSSTSEPTSLFMKWDAQEPNTIINSSNSSVSKSNQIVAQWNEAKIGNSNYSFFGSDIDGCIIKFVVDNDSYPGIFIPGYASLRTLNDGTIYYDKTIFLVLSTTWLAARNIPFYMGSNWNNIFGQTWNIGNNIWSGICFGRYTSPNTNRITIHNSSTEYTENNFTYSDLYSDTVMVKNKKIVIGYKLEFTNSTTIRNVLICSLNPTTIKYTTSTNVGTNPFKTNYTSLNCIYCLGGRPGGIQNYWYNQSGTEGDLSWSKTPGFYYELNIHNQLSESEMVTECQRLMTKWGVTI